MLCRETVSLAGTWFRDTLHELRETAFVLFRMFSFAQFVRRGALRPFRKAIVHKTASLRFGNSLLEREGYCCGEVRSRAGLVFLFQDTVFSKDFQSAGIADDDFVM